VRREAIARRWIGGLGGSRMPDPDGARPRIARLDRAGIGPESRLQAAEPLARDDHVTAEVKKYQRSCV
jgi:hypothetical protein